MSKKRKMQFIVKSKIKKSREPKVLDSAKYMQNKRAHCPFCEKDNLKMSSHYFSNPPGQKLQELKTDLFLNFEMRCNECGQTFTEVNTKEYLKSTNLDQKQQEENFQDVKTCPFCGEHNLLFDSAVLHFLDDSNYYFKIFCISCKKHFLEWYKYEFHQLKEWNGISYYQELYDRLKKKEAHLVLQLHRRNQPIHSSQEYQINNQIMEKIKESRLEKPDLYIEIPLRFRKN